MRLDKFLADRYGSRTKSSNAISEKLVLVNGSFVTPSYKYKDGDIIEFITPKESFVSAGGLKILIFLPTAKFLPISDRVTVVLPIVFCRTGPKRFTV